MAIDAKAKKELDLRLAKGEINREEYLAVYRLLEGDDSNPGSFLQRTANQLVSLRDLISEPRRMIYPTDLAPYEVTEELVLYGAHLNYQGAEYPYTAIANVSYTARSQYFNFVPMIHIATVWVNLKGGGTVIVSSNSTIVKGRAHNRILNAYEFIRAVTFKERLERYTGNLETQGYCQHGDTKIYLSGDVERNGIRVNVKLVHCNI
jgi:hypothetical protein